MNLREIAEEITSIPARQISEVRTALNNMEVAAEKEVFPDTELSPKEYGQKLMNHKRRKILMDSSLLTVDG